ncbi:Fiber protein Fb34 [Quillaja saponaria]|uniref:Fiber protein Fb34 n=1 Tax=Quillaja saponaria TaxID=32244 RepID=A0AAD7M209_QUISA|nr:Fiber protein Fb34 [Quillaja saponaria]KAJ7968512.1 Fiber protein Fb34 [Quillaja saponaria]
MASKLLLLVVFVFDLIAFALAVAAEQKRNTARVAQDGQYNHCVYNSNGATGLGVGSLVLLVASQVIVMVASRCLCCGKALTPGGSRSWAICLFITNWVTFIIAVSCLLGGSVRNAYNTKYRALVTDTPPSCDTLRKGIFAAGAAFVVLTGVVSELYYVFYSKAKDVPPPYARDSGVRMGNL